MVFTSFFARTKDVLVPTFSMIHNAMYCIYMAEYYSSFTFSHTEDAEAMGRLAVACGASVVGGIAGLMYKNIKQNSTPAAIDKSNYETIEPHTPTCWDTTKTFLTDFHTAFSLTAGPASLTYTMFPLMKLSNTLGFQILTTYSTLGSIGAGVYASRNFAFFKSCCKKTETAPTQDNASLQPA